MASGYFTTAQNGYKRDWKTENAELQRQHDERRQREEMDARVTGFLGRELYGRQFRSLEALMNTACAAAVDHQGRALNEEQHESTVRVCRALWSGDLLRPELGVPYTRREGVLTIGGPSAERVA